MIRILVETRMQQNDILRPQMLRPHAWNIHKANGFNCYYILCYIGISPNCWSLCIRCCCSGTQDGLHYIRIPESWMFWKLRCDWPNLYFHCQEVSTHASQDADSYGSRVCRLRSRCQLFLGMKGECKSNHIKNDVFKFKQWKNKTMPFVLKVQRQLITCIFEVCACTSFLSFGCEAIYLSVSKHDLRLQRWFNVLRLFNLSKGKNGMIGAINAWQDAGTFQWLDDNVWQCFSCSEIATFPLLRQWLAPEKLSWWSHPTSNTLRFFLRLRRIAKWCTPSRSSGFKRLEKDTAWKIIDGSIQIAIFKVTSALVVDDDIAAQGVGQFSLFVKRQSCVLECHWRGKEVKSWLNHVKPLEVGSARLESRYWNSGHLPGLCHLKPASLSFFRCFKGWCAKLAVGSAGIEDLRCLPISQECPTAKYKLKLTPKPTLHIPELFFYCIRGGRSPRSCCRTCFHSAVANAWRGLLVAVRAVALVPSIVVRSRTPVDWMGMSGCSHCSHYAIGDEIHFLGLVSPHFFSIFLVFFVMRSN